MRSTTAPALSATEHRLATCESRPTKRRTRSDMGDIRAAIIAILGEIRPATVRQVFYQLVSRGVIAKTEAEYKRTVVRLLTVMRREQAVPFGWIADNTRWMRKPSSYSSLSDMLVESQRLYRRALWDNQDAYVEIWLEKDALSGVLYQETAEFDVPLMVTRGYPSISYLYEAAEAVSECNKPAFLYYFGDYDPSGCDITRAVEAGIREFAPTAEIHFKRVAVTPEQITEWKLPTRPTKTTDSRSRRFDGESVEVDAVPPATLRGLVRSCIE
ncbi:MAG: hypothetical protein NT154_12885, partial [Verrucomicrobia bacterium]|nr:hypothetical protein [Verrucomicrobiota bacterium]